MYPRVFLLTILTSSTVFAQADPALPARARTVLKQHCYRCHRGAGSESGYEFDVLRDATLKAKIGEEGPVVIPNKSAESRIVIRAAIERSMPPRSVKERPNDEELGILKKWIDAGAQPFPTEIGRGKFILLTDV